MPKWPNDLRHQAIRSSHALIIEAKGLRVFAVVVVYNDDPQLFAPSRDRHKRPIIENYEGASSGMSKSRMRRWMGTTSYLGII